MTAAEHPGTPKQAERRARADRGAKPDPVPVDPDEPTPAEIREALTAGFDAPDAEAAEIARALVQRIMGAEKREDLLEPIAPINAAQVLERRIGITGYQLRKSRYPDGLRVYLLLDAVELTTGELLLIYTGAVNVLGQVIRGTALAALDVPVKFIQRPSSLHPDRSLLWLVAADAPPPQ